MSTRIIAKLDVKPPFVVKPIHFEGLRIMGTPSKLAKKYYDQGADELYYIDIVSSLYQREILFNELEAVASNLFIPLAAGGGVKSIDDFSKMIHIGADKVVINTHAIQKDPSIIDKAAKIFGSQAVVINIEAKRWKSFYECYTDCGREQTHKNVLEWSKEVESRGAGEILLQSVDMDGTCKGFELDLASEVVSISNIPVVVASGAGSIEDILKLIEVANPSGVAIASLLHYDKTTIYDIKNVINSHLVV